MIRRHGVHRWAVEQTVALMHWFRRLRIRCKTRDDIHEVFMTIAYAIICCDRQLGTGPGAAPRPR
jgi:hypothetical protein